MWAYPDGKTLRLVQGDITRIPADAIANAANSRLAGGGGVDGAIHRAGGPTIMAELDQIRHERGGCPTGGAVVTTAGNLPAKWVFHAVGPVWEGGDSGEAALLTSCYRTCLQLAEDRGAASVSFPSISTGVYGYPVNEAAEVALTLIDEHLSRSGGAVREVLLVLFDARTYRAYEQAALRWHRDLPTDPMDAQSRETAGSQDS